MHEEETGKEKGLREEEKEVASAQLLSITRRARCNAGRGCLMRNRLKQKDSVCFSRDDFFWQFRRRDDKNIRGDCGNLD